MPENVTHSQRDTTGRAILRMSSAIEDAPYALDSVELLNTELAASCRTDFDIAQAASGGSDDPNICHLEDVASCEEK